MDRQQFEALFLENYDVLNSAIRRQIYEFFYKKFITKDNGYESNYWEKLGIDFSDQQAFAGLLKKSRELDEKNQLAVRGYYLDGNEKNVNKLEDGRYLVHHFGKYNANLNFIVSSLNKSISDLFEEFNDEEENIGNFNLAYTGKLGKVKGKYFKSKKGADMFDTTVPNPPHVCIAIYWGGSCDHSRGINEVPQECLYFRHTTSNGGRTGVDYIVLPGSACQVNY